MASAPTSGSFNIYTWQINIPLWIITGITVVLVIFRILSRATAKPSKFGWDDAIIILSIITALVGTSLLSAAITAGTRVSYADLPGTLPTAFALDIASGTTWIISIPIPKLSVAALIIRIFEPSRLGRWMLLGGCSLVLALGVAEYFMNWFQCSPVAAQWDPWTYPDAICWRGSITGDAGYFLGALSAIQDICLAVYPAFRISKLQMSLEKKLSFAVVMGLGIIAAIFAIVKTAELSKLQGDPNNPVGLYNVTLETGLWSAIENDVVIIVACVPTVFPVLRWMQEQGISLLSLLSRISLLRNSSPNTPTPKQGDNSEPVTLKTQEEVRETYEMAKNRREVMSAV